MANSAIRILVFLSMQIYVCAFHMQPFALKIAKIERSLGRISLQCVQHAVQIRQQRSNVGSITMQHQPRHKSSLQIQYLTSAISIWTATLQPATAKDGTFGVLESSWRECCILLAWCFCTD